MSINIDLENFIINKIKNSSINKEPFYTLFIEDFLPDNLYYEYKTYIYNKYNDGQFKKNRIQDNKDFINESYSINNDIFFIELTNIFNNKNIKKTLFNKFYENLDDNTLNNTNIHKNEYQFVYTKKNRFQNIHTDVPFKLLSCVYYFPEIELNNSEQLNNSTILYDKNLNPFKCGKFKDNSIIFFAPHFYSYHGFNVSVDRLSLVIFYKNNKWNCNNQNNNDLINTIEKKLNEISLIEYKDKNIQNEKNKCLINSPGGRVII